MKKEIKEQFREIADKFTKDMNRIIDGIEDETKPAPDVRLWCAMKPVNWRWKRGDIITLNGKTMYKYFKTAEEFIDWCELKRYLFPLIKRPAKEGEWAMATSKVDPFHCPIRKEGDVFKITSVDRGIAVSYENRFNQDEYEVIDGYTGEYEQPEEPKRTWTDPKTGKVYELVNRRVKIGESVLIVNENDPEKRYKNGDTFIAVKGKAIYDNNGVERDGWAFFKDKIGAFAELEEYLVIDGYHGEYEHICPTCGKERGVK